MPVRSETFSTLVVRSDLHRPSYWFVLLSFLGFLSGKYFNNPTFHCIAFPILCVARLHYSAVGVELLWACFGFVIVCFIIVSFHC